MVSVNISSATVLTDKDPIWKTKRNQLISIRMMTDYHLKCANEMIQSFHDAGMDIPCSWDTAAYIEKEIIYRNLENVPLIDLN